MAVHICYNGSTVWVNSPLLRFLALLSLPMSSGAVQRGENGHQRAPGVKVRRGQPRFPATSAHGLEGGRGPRGHGPGHCSPHCQVSFRSLGPCPEDFKVLVSRVDICYYGKRPGGTDL